ncbi:MAG: cobalamin-binding protein [Gammaproteobacteria bacterium]|nr:cobalamin-binding protein [Gammaproteobacteria bacterium]
MAVARQFLSRVLLIWLGVTFTIPSVFGDISVVDDAGNNVTLRQPARRIISLAPHATELLYAAGAGDYVVGVVEYSDFPEPARLLPRVGSGAGLDLEKIAGLRPDLVIAWQSGNPSWQVARLKQLGYTVFVTEPRRIGDVAQLIGHFGKLAATETAAGETIGKFNRRWENLREQFALRPPVTVFYQILDNSLLTVGRQHLISDVIHLCGGTNVFSGLSGLTPRVDMESVLAQNPEVVLASGHEALWPAWRDRWLRWPSQTAAARGNIHFIPPDLIHRNSPRILLGAGKVCAAIEAARQARSPK